MSRKARPEAAVTDIAVAAYRIPTDFPEADGTLDWTATTLVLVTIRAGGLEGLGYGYADTATAGLIRDKLAPLLVGRDALAVPESRVAMVHDIRNLGRPGIAAMAISVLDVALWDLKAKLLGVSLADLLGRARAGTPAYGSGGFTSYPDDRLAAQLAGWAREGIGAVKMKIGRDAAADRRRVRVARDAIGPSVALYVDANGACDCKQALAQAEAFAVLGVTWFEEPVSSDDLAGLHLLRSRGPAGMEIAAGEYGYEPVYFRRMLEARAVDVLQADATRCGGVSGFLKAAALADAFGVPLSAHCAPSLHTAVGCACANLRNIEYFHDHVRIEHMLFEGAPKPTGDGILVPDTTRPGLGLDFKQADGERFRL